MRLSYHMIGDMTIYIKYIKYNFGVFKHSTLVLIAYTVYNYIRFLKKLIIYLQILINLIFSNLIFSRLHSVDSLYTDFITLMQ
nr:MAG TPA: hypothetical protein [Bacteriophage sp.]